MSLKKIQPYIVAALIVAAGLIVGRLLGTRQGQDEQGPVKKEAKPVRVRVVENGRVFRAVSMSGKLEAVRKIELYAEVSGVFLDASRPFRAGNAFGKGEVLVRIKDDVYRSTVLAERSALLNELTLLLPDLAIDFPTHFAPWKAYVENFRIDASLKPLPRAATDRIRNYVAARNIYNRFYSVRSMEETLGKYRITAPFDGVVTVSEINPGMLVRSGQKIGEFASGGGYELEASVGVKDAPFVKKGEKIELRSVDFDGAVEGVVSRVNTAIDENTQTVKVYISAEDPRLRDGMYLTAELEVPVENAVVLPRSLLGSGSTVYALDDSVIVEIPVETVALDGARAVVRGVPDGTRIVAEPVEGMYGGMELDPAGVTVTEEEGDGGSTGNGKAK